MQEKSPKNGNPPGVHRDSPVKLSKLSAEIIQVNKHFSSYIGPPNALESYDCYNILGFRVIYAFLTCLNVIWQARWHPSTYYMVSPGWGGCGMSWFIQGSVLNSPIEVTCSIKHYTRYDVCSVCMAANSPDTLSPRKKSVPANPALSHLFIPWPSVLGNQRC